MDGVRVVPSPGLEFWLYTLALAPWLLLATGMEYVSLDADTMETGLPDNIDSGLSKRWAPSDIDVFKRDAESLDRDIDSDKKWAPPELSLYKRDPWASSEVRVGRLMNQIRTRVQRNREHQRASKRRDGGLARDLGYLTTLAGSQSVPPGLLRNMALLGRTRARLSGHVHKRAVRSHPVPGGVGENAASRALGLYTQLLEGESMGQAPNTKVRFIG